jgi:hypothetical protein
MEILLLPALTSLLSGEYPATELIQSESESESYVTTDGQPASLSWNKASIWGLRPDLYYLCDLCDLFLWGALSDERSGLSFVCAAGPCQRSLSRVRVPWDLRPYYTVSDLRLPFSSPPTTRRVTVEVFDPASTRVVLGSSLYSFGPGPTENTASNTLSIVVMGGCLAIARISFPRERVYRAAAQKRPFVYLPIA